MSTVGVQCGNDKRRFRCLVVVPYIEVNIDAVESECKTDRVQSVELGDMRMIAAASRIQLRLPGGAMQPIDLDKNVLLVRVGSHGRKIVARPIITLLVITGIEGRLMSCVSRIQMHASRLPYIQKAVAIGVLNVGARHNGAPRQTNVVVRSCYLGLKGLVILGESDVECSIVSAPTPPAFARTCATHGGTVHL